jgi:hypothetical protein
MRGSILILTGLLAACTAPQVNAPSLAHRAAESIDPRVPVPEPHISTVPNAALVSQLNALVAQAVTGDDNFRPLADTAERLVTAAGEKGSESWVVAEQALTVAVAARTPVASAVGDIDALGASRVQQLGGIAAADLKAINEAAARASEIDDREAATITRLQGLLNR